MTQKPMLRGQVDARALRVQVKSWVGGSGKRGMCNAHGCWRTMFLWPLMAGSGWSALFFLVPPPRKLEGHGNAPQTAYPGLAVPWVYSNAKAQNKHVYVFLGFEFPTKSF